MAENENAENKTLVQRFLSDMSVILFISVLVIVGVAAFSVGRIEYVTKDTATSGHKSHLMTSILDVAVKSVTNINRKLETLENQLNTIRYATEDMFVSPEALKPANTVFDFDVPLGVMWWNTSVAYVYNVVKPSQLGEQANFTIERSSNLDSYFIHFFTCDVISSNFFIGFAPGYGDVFRHYPALMVSTNRQYKANNQKWYTEAIKPSNFGKMILSSPRVSDHFGWTVTTSIAFNTSNNEMLGVLGSDITVESISKKLVNVEFNDAVVSLFHRTSKSVAWHPKWTKNDTEPISLLEPSISADQWNTIMSTQSGVVVTSLFYFAHCYCWSEYILLMRVPRSIVSSTLAIVLEKLDSLVSVLTATVSTTLSLVCIISIILAVLFARNLSKRIKKTTEDARIMLDKIMTGDDVPIHNNNPRNDDPDELDEFAALLPNVINKAKQESEKNKESQIIVNPFTNNEENGWEGFVDSEVLSL